MDQAEQLRNVIKSKQTRSVSKARVITITSGKGGVGKSNIAVNLAVQLRKLGKKVIIFDADMGLANVEVMFGAIPKYNLSDMIYHGKKMQDIITEGPMEIGFISGGNGILGMNNLTKNQLSRLVLTPEPSSLTDSYSLIKALYGNPGFVRHSTNIEVVVNRTVSPEDGQIVYDKLSSVISKFLQGEVHFFGTIPQDVLLEKSVRAQKIVSLSAPNARSARAFELLAQGLIDGEPVIEEERLGIRELFFSFFK